jgi:CBS-domain-containing membrane protein
MDTAIEKLMKLRVRDVMTREVVQVSVNQSMSQAAAIFEKHHISGAPVVDEQGHCVGMLSANDFVRRGNLAAEDRCRDHSSEHVLLHEQGAPYAIDAVERDRVRCFMSPAVQGVDADASLAELGKMMCGMHVHRMVVLDHMGHPQGVVTSLDVVAAVVNAVGQ